jgi:ATP-dependent helicase HrpB
MKLPPLPIDDILAELTAELRTTSCVVVRAPTGAGKTTRVPPALLDAEVCSGQILTVEPRRIAARAAARRMADERRVSLGQEIGYQVRFDRRAGPATKLLVATPGILLQQLHGDPYLEHIGTVIFDEFHERGLESDLALGFVRLIQQTVRPELKLIAMSATLASEQVAHYLGDCRVVASDGRLHPVEIRYEPRATTVPPHVAIANASRKLIAATPGDILVFLPGWAEIRQVARELESWSIEHNVAVIPLHGDLPPGEQDAALGQWDRRKIVLATNVAETSITVEGITGVLDSGSAREVSFYPAVGLDRLQVVPISQASSDQRAGRAGRTQPGVCVRMWKEVEHRARPQHTTPEIRRVDQASAILQLAAHGIPNPLDFPWFETPPRASIEHALGVLHLLGALDSAGKITDIGQQLAKLPVHPRLGRMLLAGAQFGCLERVALAAALLAERDPFRRINKGNRPQSESDVLDRLEAIEQFRDQGRFESSIGELDRGAARYVLRAADQLLRAVDREGSSVASKVSADDAVSRSLLAAFSDRLCRRRNPGGRKGVMVGGRGVRLDQWSFVLRPQFFLAVDVDAGQQESLVRIASGVEKEWLTIEGQTSVIELEIEESTGRLSAWKRTRFFDLIVDESPTAVPQNADAKQALINAAMANLERVLPADESPAGQFRTRLRCLRSWQPGYHLPNLDTSDIRELLEHVAAPCRTLKDLQQADWLSAFRSQLSYDQMRILDREVPERYDLPSGRSAAIVYAEGQSPIIAARIQDCFGLHETPRIAGNTVPLLFHLLAPNGRPQQVTSDLQSFWQNTYPTVRKQLRGRYPKHSWPENPHDSLVK